MISRQMTDMSVERRLLDFLPVLSAKQETLAVVVVVVNATDQGWMLFLDDP